MLGNPKYKIGDIVEFKCNEQIKVGVVAIVDRFGTFENNNDVSYDILNKEDKVLYKHFQEPTIIKVIGSINPESVWD
jgi:hypothetical protein